MVRISRLRLEQADRLTDDPDTAQTAEARGARKTLLIGVVRLAYLAEMVMPYHTNFHYGLMYGRYSR